MQQIVFNTFCGSTDSVQKQVRLQQVARGEIFNEDSPMQSSDSDHNHSSSDEFNINFDKSSIHNFGLGYWIENTNVSQSTPLPCHPSDKSVFISKSSSNDTSLSSSHQKPKMQSHTQNRNSQPRTKDTEHVNYTIPKLKLPSQSFPAESEFNLHSSKKEKTIKRSKLKCPPPDYDSERKAESCVVVKDSGRLEKSFEKSNSSSNDSKSQLYAASHDIMRLTLIIDNEIYNRFSSAPRNIPETEYSKTNNYLRSNGLGKEGNVNCLTLSTENTSSLFSSDSNRDSLSFCCDIPREENKSKIENQLRSVTIDSTCKKVNVSPLVASRKRSLSSLRDDQKEISVSPKRQFIEDCIQKESVTMIESKNKCSRDMTPMDFVLFLTHRLRMYENFIYTKYCLSQPNAMKFLAESHASNWELNKNNVNQMHLVPCGFVNEIFHRALYCFGLEKKILKETLDGNSSPISGYNSSYPLEYRKIRDEYSFSLKRIRYGIGVIDELFRRKVNYQNIPQNNDVTIVRKWKHIIYYFCLHAKSAFMAKEIQYQYYAQFPSSSFEGAMDLGANNTPSGRCFSNQLPKENSKLFECKLRQKTLSPEHLCQSDIEESPHSNDSGKGSSIRILSNPNSLVSGGHTTSSLNSTPHSSVHESQIHMPGFQLYRIDEYQATASEYVRLLPEAAQLHSKIVSKIGTEPNANSRDNMIKLIYYSDICQQMCKEDLMSECLERLLTQVVHP